MLEIVNNKINDFQEFLEEKDIEYELYGCEVDLAQETGVYPVTLGHRILRTETAGMAVLSILMFELEED